MLTVNDVVRIQQPHRNTPTEDFTARVTWVEDRGEFLYFGYVPDGPNREAWGTRRMYKPGAPRSEFAATVTVIGHEETGTLSPKQTRLLMVGTRAGLAALMTLDMAALERRVAMLEAPDRPMDVPEGFTITGRKPSVPEIQFPRSKDVRTRLASMVEELEKEKL